jgi:hypothetical protein
MKSATLAQQPAHARLLAISGRLGRWWRRILPAISNGPQRPTLVRQLLAELVVADAATGDGGDKPLAGKTVVFAAR